MGRVSFRTKIFSGILLSTLAALALPLLYARVTLHDELLREARSQSLREARLAARLLDALPSGASRQQYMEELGQPAWRLTLLAPDGRVLADSTLPPDRIGNLDNHGDRPEFREALTAGEGVSTRFSNTQNNSMVYAAVRLGNGDVLRAAVPFAGLRQRIDGMLAPLSGVAAGAGLLSMLLALLLSARLRSELGQMVHVVEAISLGKYQRRLRRLPGREFAALADAVNRMAENIEEQLRTVADQKEQLESILDTMDDGVLVLDERGGIRRCNHSLAVAFPSVCGAEGAQVVEVIPAPDLQQAVEDLLWSPDSEGQRMRLQLEMPPGRHFTVNLSKARTETPALGAVAVFHDITDLMRLERVRRDFVANVSHELRTPLTAIQGYAETLAGLDEVPEDCRRFGEIIRKHGAYLAGMVEELLSLARLESDDMALPMTPLSALEPLEAALPLCRPQLEARNIRLDITIPKDIRIMGNGAYLSRVFRNLLENACRLAPEGSAIGITAQVARNEVCFRVCDHGPGITPAALPRIFERFYRVEKQRSSASTGLGLAICKHIVERHGGRIWAESPTADASTALCFTLPLLPSSSAENLHAS